MSNQYDALSQLTPEQLQALLEPYQQESDLLKDQLARAEALRKGSGTQYHTGPGAAFGAAAKILNGYTSKRDSDKAQAQLQALLQREQGSAFNAVDAWRKSNQPPPSPASPPPPVQGPPQQPQSAAGPGGMPMQAAPQQQPVMDPRLNPGALMQKQDPSMQDPTLQYLKQQDPYGLGFSPFDLSGSGGYGGGGDGG